MHFLQNKTSSTEAMSLSKCMRKEYELSDNSYDDRFLLLNEHEKNKILDGSKKKSTKRATETHVNLLHNFLSKRKHGIFEEILTAYLPSVLE